MKAILMVAKRELAERKLIFIVALGLGWVPVFAGWLPLPFASSVRNAQPALGWFLASCLAGLGGIFYGATAFPQQLRERRLGFYFARPIGGGALWWGKNLAGLVMVGITALLAMAPSWLIAPSPIHPWAIIFLFGLPISLIAVTQYLATSLASHSLLILIDLAGCVITAGAVSGCFSFYQRHGAATVGGYILSLLAVFALLALLAAHGCGMTAGRIFPQRVHSRQALVLWSLVLALGLAAASFTAWAFSGGPADLTGCLSVSPHHRTPWIIMKGTQDLRPGILRLFLVNTQTLRTISFPNPATQVLLSADGSRAVWADRDGKGEKAAESVFYFNLKDTSAVPVETRIVLTDSESQWVLSPNGSKMAVLEEDLCLIYEIESSRLLKAIRMPFKKPHDPVFLADDRLRVFVPQGEGKKARVDIFRLDILDGSLSRTGSLPNLDYVTSCATEKEDSCVTIWVSAVDSDRQSRWELHDNWTGAWIADLARARYSSRFFSPLLPDSRIALISEEGGDIWLRTFSHAGKPLETTRLNQEIANWRGMLDSGRLITVHVSGRGHSNVVSTQLVDPATGSVEKLPEGYQPVWAWEWPYPKPRRVHLFLSPDNKLVQIDPKTLIFSPVFP